MTSSPKFAVVIAGLATFTGCGSSSPDSTGVGASASGGSAASMGGVNSNGGGTATGGLISAGGLTGVGGTGPIGGSNTSNGGTSLGGVRSTGGAIGLGGVNSIGGASSIGGVAAIGGASIAIGGTTAGGVSSNGGVTTAGGAKATGGSATSGGASTAGGAKATGGTPTSGGMTATGGTAGTGGSTAIGGSTGTCSHYVDSANGNDASDGQTESTAWKSLTKVSGVTFQPGNKLCFKAGGSWTGQLWPKGSGSASAPIVIDQYGSGAKPVIAAGTADADAVRLLNQQYWEINNLAVTNKKASVGDYRGISINGQNGGTLNHIYIRNCFVHDVNGEVNWIGGDTADNAPGITFVTGWDASKHTGGIVFDVQAGTGAAVKTKFNDVIVEGNTIQDCSFGGIIFKQLDGTVHWGTRSSASSTTWTPHTNVVVRGNYLSQLNTNLGCNTIYMTNVQNGLIEQNVTNGAGTSAIELYYTDSVTIQKNETFGTKVKAGGADSNGIDTDKATTKTIIQYNYVHDNGDGILLCQFAFGDSIIRYNILQNNSRYQIYLHSDAAASSQIYNNTVYNNKANSGVAYGYGTSLDSSYTMRNNIFFAAAGNGVLTTSATITHQNNLYFGSAIQVPSGDTNAIRLDPKLASPGTGTSGSSSGPAFNSLDGYKLQTGSPAINAGTSIASNGGVDFWGGAIVGNPDIGAYESR